MKKLIKYILIIICLGFPKAWCMEKDEVPQRIETEEDFDETEFDENFQWRNSLLAFVSYLTEEQKQINGIQEFLMQTWDNPLVLDKETEIPENKLKKVRDEFLSLLDENQKEFVNEIIALYKSKKK